MLANFPMKVNRMFLSLEMYFNLFSITLCSTLNCFFLMTLFPTNNVLEHLATFELPTV